MALNLKLIFKCIVAVSIVLISQFASAHLVLKSIHHANIGSSQTPITQDVRSDVFWGIDCLQNKSIIVFSQVDCLQAKKEARHFSDCQQDHCTNGG